MPIPYKVKLNNGNENIGAEAKTITVQEIVKNAFNKERAKNAQQVADLMAMGHAVTLQSKSRAALRIYPDVSLRGRNITLARAQQLDDTITELTTANAGDLVSRVGVRVRVRAACQPAFAKLLQDAGISTQRKDTVNVPKILQGGSTPSGGGTSGSGTNPPSGDDPNGGND